MLFDTKTTFIGIRVDEWYEYEKFYCLFLGSGARSSLGIGGTKDEAFEFAMDLACGECNG